MEEVKLCKDCKWLKNYDECSAPRNYDIVDYVGGSRKRDYVYAENVRRIDRRCGHEAKWFEAREEVVEDQDGGARSRTTVKILVFIALFLVAVWYACLTIL